MFCYDKTLAVVAGFAVFAMPLSAGAVTGTVPDIWFGTNAYYTVHGLQDPLQPNPGFDPLFVPGADQSLWASNKPLGNVSTVVVGSAFIHSGKVVPPATVPIRLSNFILFLQRHSNIILGIENVTSKNKTTCAAATDTSPAVFNLSAIVNAATADGDNVMNGLKGAVQAAIPDSVNPDIPNSVVISQLSQLNPGGTTTITPTLRIQFNEFYQDIVSPLHYSGGFDNCNYTLGNDPYAISALRVATAVQAMQSDLTVGSTNSPLLPGLQNFKIQFGALESVGRFDGPGLAAWIHYYNTHIVGMVASVPAIPQTQLTLFAIPQGLVIGAQLINVNSPGLINRHVSAIAGKKITFYPPIVAGDSDVVSSGNVISFVTAPPIPFSFVNYAPDLASPFADIVSPYDPSGQPNPLSASYALKQDGLKVGFSPTGNFPSHLSTSYATISTSIRETDQSAAYWLDLTKAGLQSYLSGVTSGVNSAPDILYLTSWQSDPLPPTSATNFATPLVNVLQFAATSAAYEQPPSPLYRFYNYPAIPPNRGLSSANSASGVLFSRNGSSAYGTGRTTPPGYLPGYPVADVYPTIRGAENLQSLYRIKSNQGNERLVFGDSAAQAVAANTSTCFYTNGEWTGGANGLVGVVGYAFSSNSPPPGSVPVYELSTTTKSYASSSCPQYYYTSNQGEAIALANSGSGWQTTGPTGISFYAEPVMTEFRSFQGVTYNANLAPSPVANDPIMVLITGGAGKPWNSQLPASPGVLPANMPVPGYFAVGGVSLIMGGTPNVDLGQMDLLGQDWLNGNVITAGQGHLLSTAPSGSPGAGWDPTTCSYGCYYNLQPDGTVVVYRNYAASPPVSLPGFGSFTQSFGHLLPNANNLSYSGGDGIEIVLDNYPISSTSSLPAALLVDCANEELWSLVPDQTGMYPQTPHVATANPSADNTCWPKIVTYPGIPVN